jgi:hypothetical protein
MSKAEIRTVAYLSCATAATQESELGTTVAEL